MDRQTIIVGDVHACLDEFEELLDKLKYNPSIHRLILCGDLFDRGKFNVEMVAKARQLNLECVRGNHEQKFLTWYHSQGTRMSGIYDRYPHYSQFSEADIQYIANMPFFIELDDVAIVHAGIKPGIAISKQSKDDLMYLRYTDDQRKFVSLRKINKLGKEASGARFWTDFGSFGKSIVYGHHVHSTDDIRITSFPDGTACYGIDTGCCFGGKLSALIWETKEVVQVQAKQVYHKSDFNVR